jgi:hypothetical protein
MNNCCGNAEKMDRMNRIFRDSQDEKKVILTGLTGFT